MKTFTKIAAAALLTLSVAAPALADESTTLLERNTYLYTPDARPIVRHAQRNGVVVHHRGSDAFASEPARRPVLQPSYRDLGIGSQS